MLNKMLDVLRGRRNQVVVTARIGIKGMTCKRCVATVKKALLTKTGVNHVTVTYDANQTDIPSLHEIILRKGYFPGDAAVAA
jgi:copper chaperone CopZ